MATNELVRNDKLFTLTFTITDSAGTAINLTGSTVKFKMTDVNYTTNQINGSCVLTDAANGECSYEVQTDELNTAGIYHAELEVTYTATSKVITAILDDFRILRDAPN